MLSLGKRGTQIEGGKPIFTDNATQQHPCLQPIQAVACLEETLLTEAELLANHLNVPLTRQKPGSQKPGHHRAAQEKNGGDQALLENDPYLCFDAQGLSLRQGELALRGDFSLMAARLKRGRLSDELLVRAAKCKHGNREPLAIDATAGMGEDAFLLAAAGFSVRLYEYNPAIAALLKDALRRAAEDDTLSSIVCRMRLFEENSLDALAHLEKRPEVVLLDPMFPERKKSALVKKKFQLLHQLEWPCGSEEELLEAARSAHPRKIIIKRPVKGPFLAGCKPDYSLAGKAIRYDCFAFPESGPSHQPSC